MFKMTTCKHCI